MRDILVTLVIFGSLPVILMRPWIGILMWSWIAYMQPHRLTWGFAYNLPFAMVIGGATLAAWIFSQENKKVPWNAISVLMLLLVLWSGLSTAMAFNVPEAFRLWERFAKIILMTFVAMAMIQSRERLRWLIWVTVLSIGYFSIRGGIFTILTGGKYRVWGPPQTFIADNNALALATLMIIPLMIYLARTTSNKWVVRGLYVAVLLSFVSAVGSYSRGALVGMIPLLALLWWRSRRKVIIGIGVALVGLVAVFYIPQKWFDRMDTIEHYQEEGSAMSRIRVWTMAVRIANARPLIGGGFGAFYDVPTFRRFASEDARKPRNAHSIYFEMLGAHGYVGLAIFLALGFAGLKACSRIRRLCRRREDLKADYELATMIQCSFLAYAISGAFQNLAEYDLYYNLLAIVVVARLILVRELERSHSGETAEAASQPVEAAPAKSYLRGDTAPPSFLRPKTG